jgi:hypothetical protein
MMIQRLLSPRAVFALFSLVPMSTDGSTAQAPSAGSSTIAAAIVAVIAIRRPVLRRFTRVSARTAGANSSSTTSSL